MLASISSISVTAVNEFGNKIARFKSAKSEKVSSGELVKNNLGVYLITHISFSEAYLQFSSLALGPLSENCCSHAPCCFYYHAEKTVER